MIPSIRKCLRGLVLALVTLGVTGCGGGDGGAAEAAGDTLTQRQKDSLVSTLPVPGAGAVQKPWTRRMPPGLGPRPTTLSGDTHLERACTRGVSCQLRPKALAPGPFGNHFVSDHANQMEDVRYGRL